MSNVHRQRWATLVASGSERRRAYSPDRRHAKACDEVKTAIDLAIAQLPITGDVSVSEARRILENVAWVQEEVLAGY